MVSRHRRLNPGSLELFADTAVRRMTRCFSLLFLFLISCTLLSVCDLDGSRFLSVRIVAAESSITSDVPSETESGKLDPLLPLHDIVNPLLDREAPHVWEKPLPVECLSPLESTRVHRYRVGLPRDSVQESSPSA